MDEPPLPPDLNPEMAADGNPEAFRCRWCGSTLSGPRLGRICPTCDTPPTKE